MADPVLHLLAGPNGAGRSHLHRSVLADRVHPELVNADHTAVARWLATSWPTATTQPAPLRNAGRRPDPPRR